MPECKASGTLGMTRCYKASSASGTTFAEFTIASAMSESIVAKLVASITSLRYGTCLLRTGENS